MPYCYVGTQQSSRSASYSAAVAPAEEHLNNDIKIFYRTYGRGPTKVLLIIGPSSLSLFSFISFFFFLIVPIFFLGVADFMEIQRSGLAATHDSWGPQIKALTGTAVPNDDVSSGDDNEGGDSPGIEVCAFDNRGVGRSSVPVKKSEYSTKIMAKDAIALLDHLGWKKAHVFGHSMGAMIACKVATMIPDRVLSLALLNVTGGGFECFPKFDRQTFSIAYRFLKAKTPEQRAAVDLDTHYSQEYLEECVGTEKRRAILYQQYVKGISSSGMQSSYGFDGQLNACWTHKITQTEIEVIKSAGFLISVIHGRHDIIAQIYYAKRLAERLQPMARMVDLHGGHLVSHERPEEVNQALFDLIKASEEKMSPYDWTNLPNKQSSWWVVNLW